MHNTLQKEDIAIPSHSMTVPTPRTPEQAAELVFDRFEQMEFAFAEANQATQDLTRALGAAIEQLSALENNEDANGALRTQIDALIQRMETLDTGPVQEKLAESIDALHRKTDFLPSRLSHTEEMLDTLKAQVSSLAETLSQSGAVNTLHPTIETALERATDAHNQTLESLNNSIATLEERTAAQIDQYSKTTAQQILAAQNRINHTAETTKEAMVYRLDRRQQTPDIDRLTSEISKAVSQEIDAKLTAIDEKYGHFVEVAKNQVFRGFDKLADLNTKLDDLRSDIGSSSVIPQIEARFAALEQVLESLGSQMTNGPAGDFRSQRQSVGAMPSDIPPPSNREEQSFEELFLSIKANGAHLGEIIKKIDTLQSDAPSAQTPRTDDMQKLQTGQEAVATRLDTMIQTLEARYAHIEAKLTVPQGSIDTQVRADALATVSELARANRILASSNLGEDIVQKHTQFLSDLRIVVGECVATILRSNELEYTDVSTLTDAD